MTYVSNKPMKKIISILFTLMISFSFMITSSFASYSDASNLSANQNYLDGEILVKIKSDKNIEQVISASLNIANSQNSEFAEKIIKSDNENLKKKGFDRVYKVKVNDVDEALSLFNDNPDVEYAEPNYIVNVLETFPDDPDFNNLYGLHNTGQTGGSLDADIDAPEAWDISTGSNEVIVAVIDTGVDYNHPDLAANLWVNSNEISGNGLDDDLNGLVDDYRGWDFGNNDSDPTDEYGHGTHVAGTIGAVGNNGIGITGVAWNVKLMPVKFSHSGGTGFISNTVLAIEYAIDMDADIMSNSWGTLGFSQTLRDAIESANDAGILFVAAAGNANQNSDVNPHYPSAHDNSNIISVAATDYNDNLASFSNYGAQSVDLGAPGVTILSAVPDGICSLCDPTGYKYLNGTSMATPHVSGVAALIKSRYPGISVSDLKARILDNVDPLPSLQGITLTGGRLNAARALNVELPNTPPVSQNQTVSTQMNISIDVILASSDADEDNLTYSIVSQPVNGVLASDDGDELISYTPNLNFIGTDSISFRANDGFNDSNIAVVIINVNNPLIEEFLPDAGTTALYHFDDLTDASNNFDLSLNGNAQLASDNLGWMTNPSGKALKLNSLGDQVIVSIPDSYILPNNTASVTLEARFYPTQYLAYGIGNYNLIRITQDWDAGLGLLENIWAGRRIMSGNSIVVNSAALNANAPLNQWHKLRIIFSNGNTMVYADDNLIANQATAQNYGRTNNWILTLGNFRGYVDEVRISNVVR